MIVAAEKGNADDFEIVYFVEGLPEEAAVEVVELVLVELLMKGFL